MFQSVVKALMRFSSKYPEAVAAIGLVAIGLMLWLSYQVTALSCLAGAALIWLLMTLRWERLARADLEKRLTVTEQRLTEIGESRRQWTEQVKLDHRAQLLSVAVLVKLSARDALDALNRVSPGLVEEVLRELNLKS